MTRRRALGLLGALGAGAAGLVAAVRAATGPAPAPDVVPGTLRVPEAYGAHPRQRGEWWVPAPSSEQARGEGPLPTVVLVHGGYWRAGFDLRLEDAVAADLSGRGFLVWNIDYRPSSDPWPATLDDVAAAYEHLVRGSLASRVDPARVAVVGHSAGGHLALWLASRGRLPAGAPEPPGQPPPPSPAPAPAPALAVPQAPVAALADAWRERLGSGAVAALLGGGPQTCPDRYAAADPVALLPTGVPSVLVHAPGDDLVPLSQSTTYVAAATAAGDRSELVEVPGAHFEHLDPASAACEALRVALARL
jgi:acetyl esterase/lipase